MNNAIIINILDDGETYGSLAGCQVAVLNEDEFAQFDLGVPLDEMEVTHTFRLDDPTDLRALADLLERK